MDWKTGSVEGGGSPPHIKICFDFKLYINCHKYLFWFSQFYLEYNYCLEIYDTFFLDIQRIYSHQFSKLVTKLMTLLFFFYFFVISSFGTQFCCNKVEFNKTSADFVLKQSHIVVTNGEYFENMVL